jgi:sarcosine oxidase
MAQEAPDYLEGLVRRHGLQAGLTRHGLFKLAHSRPACRSLEADVKELQAEGVGAELLSRAELETRVGTHRYMAGAFDPRGGAVHPLDLVREYGNLLQRLGGQIFEQSRVIAIDRIGGLWHVQTPEGQVIADTIVIATNAYTDDLVAGLRQTVLPVNSFQIASSPIDDRVSETILPGGQTAHDMRRLVLYFRKTKDRRVVIGGRASFDSASEISHSADYDVLREILIDIFPTLSGATIEHRWAGLVGITTSRQPHYHSPAPGFHILLGFNGRGVALTSRAGAWLAHRILGQADTLDIPAVPLRRIPFHRFRTPLLNAAMKWHRGMDLLGY